jgi:trk system potassium uptake protein
MRYKVLAYLLGTLLFYLGIFMILPLLWSVTDGKVIFLSFLISAAASIIVGFLLRYKKTPPDDISIKESFSFVALAWPISALFGCLPFLFSGTFNGFVDAYFESMSGFTTTGATILKDIEILPQSILLWRSLTQWLGGMGIIVLFVAMLPKLGIRSINLLKAEVPGPNPERMVPRLAETAKRLWIVYLVFSAFQFIMLLVSGLNIFDSLTHTFTTMPTGGFSTYNGSIAAFNNVRAEMVIILFMILAGGNFTLYYAIWQKQWKHVLRDTELRFYLSGILIATAILTIIIYPMHYSTILEAARRASFQVISIITTTGYVTADYDSWPSLARVILFFLMFLGGSGGSTGGAMKQIRILILIKYAVRELRKVLHPSAVIPLRLGGKVIPEGMVQNILGFSFLYIFIFIISSILISAMGLNFTTSLSVVASCLGNVGPALDIVGPTHTYADLPVASKILCRLLCFWEGWKYIQY